MAVVVVSIILALLGYVFVTGLAYKYIREKAEEMEVFDVQEPPPPPEEVPPPPPPDTPVPPPPTTVVVQKPLVQVPSPPVQIQTSTVIPPSQPPTPPAPPAPPAPPPPPPPAISKAAAARGNPSSWVTNDDYPPAAIRSGDQGSVGVSFTINGEGRVENCQVTSSSGSALLDRTTCQLVTRRGRYSPALDAAGNPTNQRQSLRFRWVLPE